jgi:hypothetical protein
MAETIGGDLRDRHTGLMTGPVDPAGPPTVRTPAGSHRGGYNPVPTGVHLPSLDREVLAFWRDSAIFNRSLARTRPAAAQSGRQWTVYEGPPTANGMPGIHHVEARVFKDIFPRFKTMQGFHVQRRAGWDCLGLPLELSVEKELGFSGKEEIEAYGVAEFNARCRESVLRHVAAFEEMTRRMGYWVDMGRLPDHGPGLCRVGVVGAQADPRQGVACGGSPGGAVLSSLRHLPVRPRAGAGLRDGHRPVGLCPATAEVRARTPERPAC